MALSPANIRALTFDCYGTLIDWEQGILRILRPWANRNGVAADDDELLAAYARTESACETATPTALYPDILRRVQGQLAKVFGVAASNEDADRLAQSVGDWPVFPDTPGALAELKRHYKLVIVSNVDRTSFARTHVKLGVTFDAIITAEEVGAYKPDQRMFLRAFEVLEGMGIRRSEILHVAQSLYHDHVPAQALDLKTLRVDRRRGQAGAGVTPVPEGDVRPDDVVRNMAEAATLLRK